MLHLTNQNYEWHFYRTVVDLMNEPRAQRWAEKAFLRDPIFSSARTLSSAKPSLVRKVALSFSVFTLQRISWVSSVLFQSLEKWNSKIFTWNLVKTSEWCNEEFWNWHLDTVITCNVTSVQQSLVFVWSICFWISNNSKSRRRQYISLTTRAQQRSRVIRGQKKEKKKFPFLFHLHMSVHHSDFLFRWNKN